jgi:aminodeoxyfutalosine deaminase
MTTTIYIADYLLPIDAPPIVNGAVAVRGTQIIAVGETAAVRAQLASQPYQTVTLARCALLPGLVNVHTHLELTLLRNYLNNLNFTDWIAQLIKTRAGWTIPELEIAAIYGACEALRAGITTIADTGSSGATLTGMITVGLRGIFYQETFGSDTRQAGKSLALLQTQVADYQAQLAKLPSTRVQVGVSPHAPYSVSAALFQAVAHYAQQEQLPLAIHIAESMAETALIRDGKGVFAEQLRQRGIEVIPQNCSVIQYLADNRVLNVPPLLIHSVQVDDYDLALIKAAGASIAHCPKSNAWFGHGRAPLEKIQDLAIPVALGSDSVASNNLCDLWEEARSALFIHQAANRKIGLTARQLLQMLTLDGAKVLGLATQIGSLTVGKQADFIAVRLDDARHLPIYDIETTLIYCASGQDVCLTVIAGQPIYRDGVISTVNDQAIKTEFQAIAQKLLQQ